MDHTELSSRIFARAIAVLVLVFFVKSVWADPVMFATTRTTTTTINNAASVALPLNNAGSTVLSSFGDTSFSSTPSVR